jgi:hypothetical protein
MLSRTVPDIIQGFCEAYAIEPLIYILVWLLQRISFKMAKSKLVFPLPISPIRIVSFDFCIVVLISFKACTYLGLYSYFMDSSIGWLFIYYNVYILLYFS